MKNILFLLIFLFPFSIALSPSNSINLPIIKILALIIFIIFIIGWTMGKFKIRVESIFLLIFLFLILNFFSFLRSQDFFESFKKISTYVTILPLYFIFISVFQKNDALRIVRILSWSSFIASLGALIVFGLQFLFDKSNILNLLVDNIFPIFFGINSSEKIGAFQSLLVNISGNDYLRADLFFPDPHTQSFYLGISLPLIFYLYSKKKKFIYLTILGSVLVAFLLSFSRAGILSFLLASAISSLIYYLKERNTLKINYKMFALVGIIISAIFINTPVYQRILDSFNFNEGSISQRFSIFKEGLDKYQENPILGIGFGNYGILNKNVLDSSLPPYNLHNSYLEILVETGIFTFLSFILILIISLYIALKSSNYFYFSSILFFTIFAFFESILYSHEVLPLLMILLALNYLEFKKPLDVAIDAKVASG